ncbi:MAG: hypothetical protein HY650_08880 [Acidobacteria bacterium]|nr:hypothetical protein [Acidobacteriota bacterium]
MSNHPLRTMRPPSYGRSARLCRLAAALLAMAFYFVPRLAVAQTHEFQVEHQHTLRDCRGTLIITPDTIDYRTTHKKDSRSWPYVEIRQLKVESSTRLEIVTYEDQKRMLGRDKIFKFRLLQGQLRPDVVALLMAKSTHPPATSVMPVASGTPAFQIPVKHLHTLGGCEGLLSIYPDRVTYESKDKPTDSRYWRYADIHNFGHPTRYRFEITTFEDKYGGPTKVFNFQLKEDLPARAHDYVWVRVYPSEFYPNERPTSPTDFPPTDLPLVPR